MVIRKSSLKRAKNPHLCTIDVGSNAIRVLIAWSKGNLIYSIFENRFSLRLGADVFTHHKVSESTQDKLVFIFQLIRELMIKFRVDKYAAVATSALRSAVNGQEVIKRIENETKLQITLISGIEEAKIVQSAVMDKYVLLPKKNYLIADLGGGSLELSFISRGKVVQQNSFPLGTLRLLTCDVKTIYQHFELYLTDFAKIGRAAEGEWEMFAVGGNARSLLKINQTVFNDQRKKISQDKMFALVDLLDGLTFPERMSQLSLRPDRADVILPAAVLFWLLMNQFNISQFYPLKFGAVKALMHSNYFISFAPEKR